MTRRALQFQFSIIITIFGRLCSQPRSSLTRSLESRRGSSSNKECSIRAVLHSHFLSLCFKEIPSMHTHTWHLIA